MRVIVGAAEVWEYFQKNKSPTLYELIAEEPEYGIEIWLINNYGFPEFIVTADDIEICDEQAFEQMECEEMVSLLYNDYLTSNVISTVNNTHDEPERLSPDEEIEIRAIIEREDEINDAVCELLEVLLDSYANSTTISEVFEDLKEHILEYLYREHGISVYRPMYLEDEDGEEFFEEYPYECMVFDDKT